MEAIWETLYQEASAVINPRNVSERIYAGSVAAAIETEIGNIYVGVSVDTSCTLGVCAERNTIFNMITHNDCQIKRVLPIRSNGQSVVPCGACREMMA